MNSSLVKSYLTLRKAVGLIGLLLPFVLLAGVHLFFPDQAGVKSISHYYHTGMGDVFVGALFAVAVFLYFYNGYDQIDSRAGNIAASLALGVALFPCTNVGPSDWRGTIHLTCAALLFLTLAYISAFRFTKSSTWQTPQKKLRNKIYRGCGATIVACILAVCAYEMTLAKGSNPLPAFTFWSETAALIAFGTSWLVKGDTLFKDPE
jgi:succinate dehydrogenase/fumarate reductase cytochrome b subunit